MKTKYTESDNVKNVMGHIIKERAVMNYKEKPVRQYKLPSLFLICIDSLLTARILQNANMILNDLSISLSLLGHWFNSICRGVLSK